MGILEVIQTIRNTLGTIEVKGRDNLDRLLACIVLAEKLEVAFSETIKEGKPDGDSDRTDEG